MVQPNAQRYINNFVSYKLRCNYIGIRNCRVIFMSEISFEQSISLNKRDISWRIAITK